MDNQPDIDSFDTFAEDLLAERSARSLIIVGASKVDDLLLQILQSFLLPKTSRTRDQDELLEGDTPLATLSARIKISHRLGLVDATLYRALECVRALRNLSAHSVSFDSTKSPVRDHIAELRKQVTHRRSFKLTKGTYFGDEPLTAIHELQCLLLTLAVLLEAIREQVTQTTGNQDTLRIAAK